MMTQAKSRFRRRRGFTLMELLVVLAILVLLAGLVVPRILGTQKRADIDATKTQIGSFKGALERYAFNMGDFPTTEQGLVALIEAPAAEDAEATGATKWQGSYLTADEIPKDPWGNDYGYRYPPEQSKGEYPEIWSNGPDGEPDTADDICSWKKAAEGEEGLDEPSPKSKADTRTTDADLLPE